MAVSLNPLSGMFDFVKSRAEVMRDYFSATAAPRGAVSNANWAVSYDATTRTVTFTPTGSQDIYAGGKKFTFAAPIAKTHAVTSPSDYFIYLDNAGALQEQTTPWDIGDGNVAPMAFIRYDSTQTPNGYCLYEVHGTTYMPGEHRELHEAIGTYQVPDGNAGGLTGGTYTVYTPASNATNPTLATIAPGVAAITLADEDIRRVQTALADGGPYQKFQKLWTTNKWVWTEDASAPYYQVGNIAQYNPSSGLDAMVNLLNNDYFCVYLLRMAPSADAASQKFRNVWVQGQVKYTPTANNDTARDAARNLALAEDYRASLDLAGLPPEYFVDAKIVVRYSTAFSNNAYRIRLAGYQKLTGSRAQAVAVAPGAITSLNDTNVNITSTTSGGFDSAVEVTQKLMNERQFNFDYIPNWIASSAYRVGNAVRIYNSVYVCTTANSDANFTGTKWQKISDCERNFIRNPDAETGTVGVSSTGANAVTIAQNFTTPLFGLNSFNLTQGVAGAWEVTWTCDTIDLGLLNRLGEFSIVMQGSALTGGYLRVKSDSNVVFEQTAAGNLTLDASKPIKFGGTFPWGQLPATYTVTLGGTGAINGNLLVDQLYLGAPISVSSGGITTEWQSYTPIGGDQWTANATYAGKWRRVGDTMEIFASVVAGATTPTGGDTGSTRISLPTGYSIDTNKLNSSTANESVLGIFQATITGVGNFGGQVRKHTSNTQFELWPVQPAAADYKTSYSTLSADQLTNSGGQVGKAYVHVTVPIVGWAATDIVTPESSISGIARYSSNTAQTIEAGAEVLDFETKVFDINNEVTTGAAWKFTAKTSGYYQVNASILMAATTAFTAGEYLALAIRKNGAQVKTSEYSPQASGVSNTPFLTVSDVVSLAVGDTIDVYIANGSGATLTTFGAGGSTYSNVSIAKITGPGSQSFYLSSPLVADPVTNVAKMKSNTGVDIFTVDGVTKRINEATTITKSTIAAGSITSIDSPLTFASNNNQVALITNPTGGGGFFHIAYGSVATVFMFDGIIGPTLVGPGAPYFYTSGVAGMVITKDGSNNLVITNKTGANYNIKLVCLTSTVTLTSVT